MQSNLIILAAEGGGMSIMGILPFIAIMGLFYFMLIRPQRQQQKKADEMRKALRNGDKVITVGGIHGIVTGVTDSTVSIKISDGVSVKFDKSSIATVETKKSADEA
ncbi:MAG: preprotein translocase subunit YajC, partial [Verrucomicrobiota bacterium]